MTPVQPQKDTSNNVIAVLIVGIILIVLLLLWKSYAVPPTADVNDNMTSSGTVL